jgi:hypothetical protein
VLHAFDDHVEQIAALRHEQYQTGDPGLHRKCRQYRAAIYGPSVRGQHIGNRQQGEYTYDTHERLHRAAFCSDWGIGVPSLNEHGLPVQTRCQCGRKDLQVRS